MPRYALIAINSSYSHSCLALLYLRQELACHLPAAEVALSQFTVNDPYYPTLLRLAALDAEALFFPVYIWNGGYVARLLRDLALLRPGRPLILGGPQAGALTGLPSCCTVVRGEIEGVGAELYRDLAAGTLRPSYEAAAGQPFPSPYRAEDFAGPLAHRLLYYESSRGCPFRCAYCLSAVQRGARHKELRQVEAELASILAHAPRIIKFVDRTFNDNPDRALAIWRWLATQPHPARFHFEVAPDRFTEEMFAFLATLAPGRFQFEIGIQSTDPAALQAINRTMDVAAALANVRRLAELGTVHLHLDLILGLPGETGESFRRGFNAVFALGADHLQMGLLKVLPETPLRAAAQRFGLVYCGEPPYEVLASSSLPHAELRELHALGACVETFHNTRFFPSLWRYLRRSGEEPFVFFQDLLGVCRAGGFFDLAPTQELLARMMAELARSRPDRDLLLELMRYDWLACGHRFLPSFLEARPLSELRADLRRRLPASMEGCYDPRTRSEFLKRGMFLELSGPALAETGLGRSGGPGATLCFLPQAGAEAKRTTGVQVLALPIAAGGV